MKLPIGWREMSIDGRPAAVLWTQEYDCNVWVDGFGSLHILTGCAPVDVVAAVLAANDNAAPEPSGERVR